MMELVRQKKEAALIAPTADTEGRHFSLRRESSESVESRKYFQ